MTLFRRTLLSLAASPLCLVIASIAPHAEGASVPERRIDQVEAQKAETQNTISIAQGYKRPPGEIGEGGDALYPEDQSDGGPQDSAGLLIRLGRLESQMRQINGQIEQMQFETRRLEEQLKKFQEDVEFRFRDGSQRVPGANPSQRRGEALQPRIHGDYSAEPPAQHAAVTAPRANGRGDAFDPTQAPDAPGTPRSLGSSAANRPVQGLIDNGQAGSDPIDPGAPLDLSNGRSKTAGAPATTPDPPLAPGGMDSHSVRSSRGPVNPNLANTPKGEFELAMASLKQGSYEDAEKGFAGFLTKNPKDKMASDATYYLGESYYLRGRKREAAEQFLKASTQYANSPRAPQALLRLGQSLSALGAKEQACATFSEISRKYPDAPAMVKTGANREAKRSQC
jgi:tol-pal system protein YbgF